MNKKLTIKDIAELAGVSFKTVSRVINNEAGVRESTKKKVQKVLEETNYTSNFFAKNLRRKSNKTVIISVKKNKGSFFNQSSGIVLKNIIDEAKKFDFEILIDSFEGEKLNTKILESGYIDGAIVFDAFEEDIRIDTLNKLSIPMVIAGKHNRETYVTCNNLIGGYLATDYLLKKNLKNIVFILGPEKALLNKERIEGFIKAHRENACKYNKDKIFSGVSSYEKVYQLTKQLIEKRDLPDAFFISGDERSLGAMKALNESGIKVPEEVSIIGFDDIPLASYIYPGITTIRQDLEVIGKELFSILYKKMNGEDVESLEVPVKLVRRQSSK